MYGICICLWGMLKYSLLLWGIRTYWLFGRVLQVRTKCGATSCPARCGRLPDEFLWTMMGLPRKPLSCSGRCLWVIRCTFSLLMKWLPRVGNLPGWWSTTGYRILLPPIPMKKEQQILEIDIPVCRGKIMILKNRYATQWLLHSGKITRENPPRRNPLQ